MSTTPLFDETVPATSTPPRLVTSPAPPPATGFEPLHAAALLAGGARPRDLRTIVATWDGLDAYLSASPEALAAAGVDRIEPVELRLGEAWALVLGGPGYPPALALTAAAPPVLFGRGDPAALALGVAVVGTRQITALGAAAATAAVAGAAAAGAPVHSGLALGVDAAAHRAALDAGVPTVAVLASGVEALTPRANAALGEEILAAGGAVVSEQLPATAPNGPRLQARNRIIAALASVVVVCEAGLASGTMGTVWAALAADRPVLVPAPRPWARSQPGAAALVALADPAGMDPKTYGVSGRAAAALRRARPVASGVAATPAELAELVALAHRMSPLTPQRLTP